MKNALLQKFLKDQELEDYYQLTHRSDEESRRYCSVCQSPYQREEDAEMQSCCLEAQVIPV